MSRYVAIRPRAWASDTHVPESLPTCTVFESDKTPVNTGLLNVEGVPLYRVPETVPPGFVGKNVYPPK